MEKKHSSLLWVIAVSAAVISLVVLCRDTVYAEYRSQHPDMSLPEVFVSAAQNEIYPWTENAPAAQDEIYPRTENVPVEETAAESLKTAETETVPEGAAPAKTGAAALKTAAEETETSVMNTGEAAAETEATVMKTGETEAVLMKTAAAAEQTGPAFDPRYSGDNTVPETQTSGEADAAPAGQDAAQGETAAAGTTAPDPVYQTKDVTYFEDACFVGDSFTEGISMYAQIPKTDYYGYKGLSTYNILKHEFKLPGGGSGTLEQALAQKKYGKVYILLGINEVGGADPAPFTERYSNIISKIQKANPDTVIYIQSILHTTQKKSDGSQFKNQYINAYNDALKKLADNKHIFYIDINPLFDDANGALSSERSTDGVHIKVPCYVEWRDHLLRHAV